MILEDNTNEISALIIGKGGEKLFGMPCKDLVMNQRLIDQQQLPNEFLRLIGQKKIFHLQFGNRKNSFNSSDVLVYNVSDDTAIEPITPQILPRAVTISSTTVSSSTSPPETSGESHKRKKESVRKALFTGSEQRYRFKLHSIIKSDTFILLPCVQIFICSGYLALLNIYLSRIFFSFFLKTQFE